MSISTTIDEILRRRKARVPLVDNAISHYRILLEELKNLEALRSEIVGKDGEAKDGPYKVFLQKRPEMKDRIFNLSTRQLCQDLNQQIEKSNKLKKRFERDHISLQVYGDAGSGKSTFIQHITGLVNDDVILASSGDHCTGASSYIFNIEANEFYAHIYFYTSKEILDNFNAILEKVLSNNGLPKRELGSFSDIGDFNIEEYGTDEFPINEDTEGVDALLLYKKHFVTISQLINFEIDAEGRPFNPACIEVDEEHRRFFKTTNKSIIKLYVAQHDGSRDDEPGHQRYYSYLAVKCVKIYTHFPYSDSGKIVLMDNVGLGDSANDAKTQNDMYDAIADNSDGVIMLYYPGLQGSWKKDDKQNLARLDNLNYMEYEDESGKKQKEERVNVNTLFFVLNKRIIGNTSNENECKDLRNRFLREKNESEDKRGYGRKETILISDVSNDNEVTNNAIIPIMEQIAKNLDEIDKNIIKDVNSNGAKLYKKLSALCRELQEISFDEPTDGDLWGGIHKQIQILLKAIETKMGVIYSNAEENKNNTYSNICSAMENRTTHIYEYVCKKDEIENSINTMGRNDTFNSVYEREMTEIRSRISNAFEKAAIDSIKDLPQNVKDKLYCLLFDEARWNILPLKSGEKYKNPSEEWMRCIIDEYLEKLPHLKECVEFIQSYSIRIDDYIDYQVESALTSLDPHSNEYQNLRPHFPEKKEGMNIMEHNKLIAKAIFDGMYDHLTAVKEGLKHQFDVLALLPYHSVYARIRKFREKLLMSNEGLQELEQFYYKNARIFWPNEFASKDRTGNTVTEWNTLVNKILGLQDISLYTVQIEKETSNN